VLQASYHTSFQNWDVHNMLPEMLVRARAGSRKQPSLCDVRHGQGYGEAARILNCRRIHVDRAWAQPCTTAALMRITFSPGSTLASEDRRSRRGHNRLQSHGFARHMWPARLQYATTLSHMSRGAIVRRRLTFHGDRHGRRTPRGVDLWHRCEYLSLVTLAYCYLLL
jgi:hypothetical protein